jgi:hypothetical protein
MVDRPDPQPRGLGRRRYSTTSARPGGPVPRRDGPSLQLRAPASTITTTISFSDQANPRAHSCSPSEQKSPTPDLGSVLLLRCSSVAETARSRSKQEAAVGASGVLVSFRTGSVAGPWARARYPGRKQQRVAAESTRREFPFPRQAGQATAGRGRRVPTRKQVRLCGRSLAWRSARPGPAIDRGVANALVRRMAAVGRKGSSGTVVGHACLGRKRKRGRLGVGFDGLPALPMQNADLASFIALMPLVPSVVLAWPAGPVRVREGGAIAGRLRGPPG